MTELKAYWHLDGVYDTELKKDCVEAESLDGEYFVFDYEDEVYLKSEADKYIAELEESRMMWVNRCGVAEESEAKLAKQLRHAKYKRCLAMARWCFERAQRMIDLYRGVNSRKNLWIRWNCRWLELAEKLMTKLKPFIVLYDGKFIRAYNESDEDNVIAELEESQRWRKFSEEKPTEEMEGEDFIVSNGYYSVVCEWRGYWNNEPFCGDKNCDEVVWWIPLPSATKEDK